MKLAILSAALLLALSSAAQCVPGPVVPTPESDAGTVVDAGPQKCTLSPAGCACENLANLACEEGSDPYCVQNFEHAMVERVTYLDVECIASAPSKDTVRDCAGMQNGCP